MRNAIVIACLVMLACNPDGEFSSGDRVGTITKFSHKGWFSKSWEGELAMDGFKPSGENAMGNVFAFSVDNDAVVPQVQSALQSGAKVRMHYKQINWNDGCSYDSDYRVQSVEPLKP